MRQFVTIAANAFMELVRQPVFLLLTTGTSLFIVFLSVVPYFGFGDDPKMVKDSVLAVMLLSGLFGAVLSASASVAHEIRSGTALAVLSKPVGRAVFILAKYFGLAGALTILVYVNGTSSLLAGKMAFDAYGDANWLAFGIFAGAIALAYLMGGFTNYFMRRGFVADAVLFLVVMVTLAFVVANFWDNHGKSQAWASDVDWRMIPASVLVLFAVFILAGLALACSTRFEMIPTLAICSALFLLGLMSDYLFGRRAESGTWWAQMLYAAVPNWQLFWVADAIEGNTYIFGIWGYVATAFGYVVGYLGASLALAVMLFQDRELN